jgi:hypothetical protein
MSKIHILSGWLFVIALFLASCEAYNTVPGKVNGGLPGQVTPGASNKKPVDCVSNPDFQCDTNNNPVTPLPPLTPQVTFAPNPPLSNPNQPGPTEDVTAWSVYKDSAFHFQIAYPPRFVFKAWEKTVLVKMQPEPVAGVDFSNPSTSLGGIVPSQLAIRIYEIGTGTSVETWLKTNGLYIPDDGWTIEEYHGTHFSGYRENSSLYIAPGSFIYAIQGKYLYQLTPLGSQAETMLTTFEFTQ